MFMARADPIMPEPASPRRWLSIVGIGEEGVEGLSAAARGLVSGADIVFGGERHLSLAAPLINGEAKPWPSPFSRAVGRPDESMTITTLASAGDTPADMATLIIVGSSETRVIPREGQSPLVYTPRAVEGVSA